MPSPLRQAVKRSLELSVPRRYLLVRGSTTRRMAALTFDDGPHPELTGRVLDILREYGARATFFVIGQNVMRHPALVARIAAEGHELGHHSYTHGEPHTTSAYRLAAEIGETRRALKRCGQAKIRFFRPPHGKVTPAKLLAAWCSGLGVALWSADPKDFAAASAERIREYFRQSPIRNGDVVLLHDTSAETVDALPDVIKAGHHAGLTFVRLGDLIG